MTRDRLVVIGGDAAGMSAVAQARRLRDAADLDVVVLEQGPDVSYSACGIPYWVGGQVEDRDRLIAVLGDPHVGSFAVVAIVLQLIAKLVLLHALFEREAFAAALLVPFAARIGPLVWSRALPDLHAGLGSRFRNAVRPVDFAGWGGLLLAAAWVSPSLLAAPLIFLVWGWWLLRRIGGISGDGHGAGIEIGESLLLAAALLWAHVA